MGTFEPSVGISSFQEVDALQTSNPGDTVVDISRLFIFTEFVNFRRQRGDSNRETAEQVKEVEGREEAEGKEVEEG